LWVGLTPDLIALNVDPRPIYIVNLYVAAFVFISILVDLHHSFIAFFAVKQLLNIIGVLRIQIVPQPSHLASTIDIWQLDAGLLICAWVVTDLIGLEGSLALPLLQNQFFLLVVNVDETFVFLLLANELVGLL